MTRLRNALLLSDFQREVRVRKAKKCLLVSVTTAVHGVVEVPMEQIVRLFLNHLFEVLDVIRSRCDMTLFLRECASIDARVAPDDPLRLAANYDLIPKCAALLHDTAAPSSTQRGAATKAAKRKKKQRQATAKANVKASARPTQRVEQAKQAATAKRKSKTNAKKTRPAAEPPGWYLTPPSLSPAARRKTPHEEAAEAAQAAEAARIMALYRESTEALQQTPSWNRKDIGYWD
ncbi:hypothetical protein [Deinococcus yavapaiensis]|uniref:Uncharacterized protein n=1 Tax=Deinococcus yavapaiensis KR-236 TaxID=694435 RepID=A0A318S4L5_9DEIO|nr:hypothetical protein [Deinococcus yavapaiensis]PYE52008.1 hypothetical protein DES52_11354 [Deinococcus yavapaiensis KR-236]